MPVSDNRTLTHTFGENVTIRKQAPGSRDSKGIFVPGAITERHIRAATAPMRTFETRLVDGTIRDVLPEGARLEQARKFYIPAPDGTAPVSPVRTRENISDADIIIHKNDEYSVLAVIDYSDSGYVEVLGVRADDV